jgi:hypothetical protein
MTYYWNVSGSKLYNTSPCGKIWSKDNVEWKFLLLGGVCSIATFHVGLTFEACIGFWGFRHPALQNLKVHWTCRLQMRIVFWGGMPWMPSMVQFSLVKLFLTFSPISNKNEVLASFSRFQESYNLCQLEKHLLCFLWINVNRLSPWHNLWLLVCWQWGLSF